MTLAEAIAELKRIGPVYDQAVRIVGPLGAAKRTSLEALDSKPARFTAMDELERRVAHANEGVAMSATSERFASGQWWTDTDWEAIEGEP